MWSLRVTSFAQQARKRSVDQKCQRLKIMSTFDSEKIGTYCLSIL